MERSVGARMLCPIAVKLSAAVAVAQCTPPCLCPPPRIGIMARGRLRCLGTSLRLKARFGSGYHVSIRMLAGEEAGAEGWAQAGGSSSSGSAGGGGFSAAMAVAMLAPSAYDNPLCEICPASPGEAPNGPAGPARRAGSSSSVGGASGRRRSPAAAKQAAAVRLLFRERLVVEPSKRRGGGTGV